MYTCTEQVGICGDQVPSDQLGRPSGQQHHAGDQEQQQPHRRVLATTAVPATAFLISRPSNPVSAIVPPAMPHASVVLGHDQFHVPAILHHHDKFQVIKIIIYILACFLLQVCIFFFYTLGGVALLHVFFSKKRAIHIVLRKKKS
jgi:hypothetical protein